MYVISNYFSIVFCLFEVYIASFNVYYVGLCSVISRLEPSIYFSIVVIACNLIKTKNLFGFFRKDIFFIILLNKFIEYIK